MSEQIKRCTKCYGDLEFIESDKVYKCRFCGTIFNDTEKVLKHDLFQKAESLMLSDHYSEADSILCLILCKDPSNREALLDRILCTARLPRLEAMSEADRLLPVREINVSKRIDETLEACKSEDKHFFELIQNFFGHVSELKKLYTRSRSLQHQKDNISRTLDMMHINDRARVTLYELDYKEENNTCRQFYRNKKQSTDLDAKIANLLGIIRNSYLEISMLHETT